jgi:DNA-binding NarL/FixJ family response regulator
MNKIRIVVADDHPVVRKGLAATMAAEPDFDVVAEAADGEMALALIRKLLPDVAVLDLDMPKLDGFAVAGEARKLGLRVQVIFLTIHSEVELLRRAMDLGARGYIVKESALLEIASGVRSVAGGRAFVSPSLTPALLERRARVQGLRRGVPLLGDLTPSERRILNLIAGSKSTKEIAAQLHIHYRTVETHRSSICQKLNLNGPNTLLRFALEHKSELLD